MRCEVRGARCEVRVARCESSGRDKGRKEGVEGGGVRDAATNRGGSGRPKRCR